MLTSKQRSILRSMGNELEPILIVGKGGITANTIEQLDQALSARELVKGRVLPHTEWDTRETASELAEATGADVVQVIGRNILFYRPPETGRSPRIDLSGEG
ncbi:RNA-binding protein [Hydrogenispora ethanolica]|uniref:RNA-binding protein n=1 Tax=Hydrogenispora ethanolica TaxID=1082276 RepID=A0A4R1RBH9_HYDET|nr:YhbY family RNA-binding protein [Hydrogenispora ethanolica]TCL63039.1 RNA-binding protein [Hydrogenispora ethanolica]